MDNPVRNLREHLGINQHQFADLVGRSYASIQGYESGKRVPPEVIERMKTIAAERGLADVALILSSEEWQVRHVLHPGETLIGARPVPVPATNSAYNPRNARWHDMLEAILESGDEKAIKAVEPNLAIFYAWVTERHPQKPAKKSAKG
jgi:transcriptional regulator with XRE-family HTH domain